MPLRQTPYRRPSPRAAIAWAIAVSTGVAVYAASHVAVTSRQLATLTLDGWFYNLLLAAPAVLCARRARQHRAWAMLGGAILLWAAGQCVWSASVETESAGVGWYDALWTGSYALLLPAAAALALPSLRRASPSELLDAVTVVLCVLAVASSLVLPTVADTRRPGPDLAVNIAYVAADTVLVALVAVVLTVSGLRAGARWAWLAAGAVLLTVADINYVLRIMAGDAVSFTIEDVTWPAAMLAFGMAALPAAPAPIDGTPDWRAIVPALTVGSIATALLVTAALGRSSHPVGVALAAATVVGVTARVAVTYARSLALAERLRIAAREAQVDPITGLPNYRSLMVALAARLLERAESGRPVSLVLVLADRSQGDRDTRGAMLTDDGLRAVGEALADDPDAPESALVASLGAGQIAWLLPDRTAEETIAAVAAGRSRAARVAGGELRMIAGIATARADLTALDLVAAADQALRIAIERGDPSVCVYEASIGEIGRGIDPEGPRSGQALGAVRALARAIDAKDTFTRRHSERVADLARRIALVRGWDAGKVADLHLAGLVHDVGKIGVPDALLLAPDPLSLAARRHLRGHADLGSRIVAEVLGPEQVLWVRHHHERLDGDGYPDGLRGDTIPEGARILAVADAWDAMVAGRPYQGALAPAAALRTMREGAGTQWCPLCVEALGRVVGVEAESDELVNGEARSPGAAIRSTS